MRRVLLLTSLLVAITACTSPTDPVRTSPAEQGELESSAVSSDSFWADDLGSGCQPPPDAVEGGAWSCAEQTTPDPQAEQERLAALTQEAQDSSAQDAQRAEEERLQQVMAGDEAAHPELTAEDEALAASGDLPADRGSLLIRTDFTHQPRWEALVGALQTPSPEGFVPFLSTVEHQRWAGASIADVAAAAPPDVLLVLADATALSSPEVPLLVLQVRGGAVQQLRVAPQALASVENNLSIANTDWEDFAGSTDPDGVFRGFA
ncbi:cell envelope integrity TolA family protein [Kineococcus esterisolvens]|uniref:cell envelope integrity protein TolA n=1 Tax=unclassified Kineococcus TaxID=2621656 RepID=UPI003D7E032D